MARHVYHCPLRWADMDSLGHVNNVTYIDYLQEARVDMLREHAPVRGGEELAEAAVVVRHEVDFVAPLVHRAEPVRIETWVVDVRAASFTLAYEILDVLPDGSRRVYVRARTVLTPFVFAEERPRRITEVERGVLGAMRDDDPGVPPRPDRTEEDGMRHHYDCHVRFSDVDVYQHVNNVKYGEYYQEARIAMLDRFLSSDAPPEERFGVVVARLEVDYRRPILLRPEPYAIDSRVVHVGDTSLVLRSEIRDGEEVLSKARAVLVAWDRDAQRPRPLPDGAREVLAGG